MPHTHASICLMTFVNVSICVHFLYYFSADMCAERRMIKAAKCTFFLHIPTLSEKNIFIIPYFRMDCKKNCAKFQKNFLSQ